MEHFEVYLEFTLLKTVTCRSVPSLGSSFSVRERFRTEELPGSYKVSAQLWRLLRFHVTLRNLSRGARAALKRRSTCCRFCVQIAPDVGSARFGWQPASV